MHRKHGICAAAAPVCGETDERLAGTWETMSNDFETARIPIPAFVVKRTLRTTASSDLLSDAVTFLALNILLCGFKRLTNKLFPGHHSAGSGRFQGENHTVRQASLSDITGDGQLPESDINNSEGLTFHSNLHNH